MGARQRLVLALALALACAAAPSSVLALRLAPRGTVRSAQASAGLAADQDQDSAVAADSSSGTIGESEGEGHAVGAANGGSAAMMLSAADWEQALRYTLERAVTDGGVRIHYVMAGDAVMRELHASLCAVLGGADAGSGEAGAQLWQLGGSARTCRNGGGILGSVRATYAPTECCRLLPEARQALLDAAAVEGSDVVLVAGCGSELLHLGNAAPMRCVGSAAQLTDTLEELLADSSEVRACFALAAVYVVAALGRGTRVPTAGWGWLMRASV